MATWPIITTIIAVCGFLFTCSSPSDHDFIQVCSQIPDGEKFIQAAGGGVHPSYNSNNLDFDFVLIKLASPVAINANVSLACLPPDVTQVRYFAEILECQFYNYIRPNGLPIPR